MTTAHRNTTVVRLVFHSWLYGSITFDAGGTERLEPKESGPGGLTSLSSYRYERDLTEAAGNVEFMLKPRAEGVTFKPVGVANKVPPTFDWIDLLQQGDWWQMSIERNNQVLGVDVGIIDQISPSFRADFTGATVGTISVQGRGFGYALADVPIYFNPHDKVADNAAGIRMLQIINGQSGTAKQMIPNIIRGMLGALNDGAARLLGGQLQHPPSLEQLVTGVGPVGFIPNTRPYWVDLLDVEKHVQDVEGQVVIPQPVIAMQESDQSVWDFINEWRNPPFNEVFVDIHPEGAEVTGFLVVRERPFVNVNDGEDSPWFSLTQSYLEASKCQSVNLSYGQNRINHVLLTGKMTGPLGEDPFALHPPVANFESIERYGLRRLSESTRFFEDIGRGAAEATLKSWRSRLVCWNILNHRYLNGSLSIAEARADIRVGQKLVIVDGPLATYSAFPASTDLPRDPDSVKSSDALTFYVEGVRLEGDLGTNPTHRTTLRVTRGYRENARLDDIAEEYAKWQDQTGADLGSGRSQTDKSTLNVNKPIVPSEGVAYDDKGVTS